MTNNSYVSAGARPKPVKKITSLALTHIFLIITSATMIVPFIWMLLSSFKLDSEILSVPIKWLPAEWHFDNYARTFQIAPWGLYFRNTIGITVSVIAGQLLVASWAAYAFARLEFKGKNIVFILYLSTMMLPYQVTMVPTFKIIRTLGWIDNLLSLIVPSMFSCFGVFMLRQFFLSIPTELEDAAKIDGCGYPRIYWEIIMRNSMPVLVTLVLFIFMHSWNDFLRPMLYLNNPRLWTLSLGLAKFKGEYTSLWSSMMCGAVVTILPILVVFLFAQKYFIEGIVTSGLKG